MRMVCRISTVPAVSLPDSDVDDARSSARELCARLETCDHDLSLAEWGELLAYAHPDEYADPSAPAAPPSDAVTVESRISDLARRAKNKQPLYHARDLWARNRSARPGDDTNAGVEIGRHDTNGSVYQRGYRDD